MKQPFDLATLPAEKECTGVGVLADGCLLVWHPGETRITTVESDATAVDAQDCYALACACKLNTLWLCPGSQVSLHLAEHPDSFDPAWLYDSYKITVKRRDGDRIPQNAKITVKQGKYGSKPYIYVVMPDHDPTWLEDQDAAAVSWAFSDVEHPREFLGTLITIYQKMGVHLSTSPAATGIQSMKLLTSPDEWRHDDEERDLPDAKPIQMYWHRPLFAKEEGLYLHRADGNAKWLAACTGAELGIGKPTRYVEGRAAQLAWEERHEAALWCVEVRSIGEPGMLQPHKSEWTGPRWLTTSGVRAMHNLGYNAPIYRAHLWENDKARKIFQHRRVLKDYGHETWNQRQAIREKYGKEHPAARLLSMTYKRGLGWLDLQGLRRDEKVSWYHKPHWYAEIMGLAEYRMTITMQMMCSAYGIMPVLIYSDALCYVSADPDPVHAWPKLFLRQHDLGGFKPDLSLPITSEVLEAFERPGSAQVLERLKMIEAAHGTHV